MFQKKRKKEKIAQLKKLVGFSENNHMWMTSEAHQCIEALFVSLLKQIVIFFNNMPLIIHTLHNMPCE